MPRTSAKTINVQLAECLRCKHPQWFISAGESNVPHGDSKRPDIVVYRQELPTVCLQTKLSPAFNLEAEARAQLGIEDYLAEGGKLKWCIAVELPKSLGIVPARDLKDAVEQIRCRFALFTCDSEGDSAVQVARWPAYGWLSGSLDDLAVSIEAVALSEIDASVAIRILKKDLSQTARFLVSNSSRRTLAQLAAVLGQLPGDFVCLMVSTVLSNALICHKHLPSLHPDVKSIYSCRGDSEEYHKASVLKVWREILDINYWPIFQLAVKLLEIIPERHVSNVVAKLDRMAARLVMIGALQIQPLLGKALQNLCTEHKYTPTIHTLQPSAMLLAELAVSRLNVNWTDPVAIHSLRIADFACGSGSLLGAAYNAIASRHRRAGGNDCHLHRGVMENVLIGADISPVAVQLTAATLFSMHLEIDFDHARIIEMPYGGKENGYGVSIGSLDLMSTGETLLVFGSGRTALSKSGTIGTGQQNPIAGVPTYGDSIVDTLEIPHGSMDVVIMNPPFSKSSNRGLVDAAFPLSDGVHSNKNIPAMMSDKLRTITKKLDRPAGHGTAGLASNFIDLANAKLRPGGVLALVLPAAFAHGLAWKNARRLIRRRYRDILVMGLATNGNADRTFSADTGMAEILLIATRKDDKTSGKEKICIANLLARPNNPLEAWITARSINLCRQDQSLDYGPVQHTDRQRIGSFFRSNEWTAVGIREYALARFTAAIALGDLLLPQKRKPVPIPVCPLDRLGRRGYLDGDINGRTSDGQPRGPFSIEPLSTVPEYPVLWSHDASRERQLIVVPDSQALARLDCQERGAILWQEGASRLHINRDFQLNSQSLAACLTERLTLGGRAWPNFLTNKLWDIPIVLWANSTMGLVSFWWAGTCQQSGRSRLTITRLPQLPCIDASSLSPEQISKCEHIFDELRDRSFLPANEAYRDEARQALDRMLLIDVLGLDAGLMDHLAILRNQWCAEPSVHGGKDTRPH